MCCEWHSVVTLRSAILLQTGNYWRGLCYYHVLCNNVINFFLISTALVLYNKTTFCTSFIVIFCNYGILSIRVTAKYLLLLIF